MNFKILMEQLLSISKSILSAKGKKVVFLIGNTGAGKSTTVAALLGAKFRENNLAIEIDCEEGDLAKFPTLAKNLTRA